MVSFYEYLLIIPLILFSFGSLPKIMKKVGDSTYVKQQMLRVESQTGKTPEENSPGSKQIPSEPLPLETKTGKASFYGKKHNGRRTASGEIYDLDGLTAAHKSYPFGTVVKVTYNGIKTVLVKINDRLPKQSKRMIDLSFKAAKELDFLRKGIANVKIEVVEWGKDKIGMKKTDDLALSQKTDSALRK
ncbi:MAG: septal ring lytic transglycosylase RlpA family protein [Bacillota bacterium]